MVCGKVKGEQRNNGDGSNVIKIAIERKTVYHKFSALSRWGKNNQLNTVFIFKISIFFENCK